MVKSNVPASRSRAMRCSPEAPREFWHVDDDPRMRAEPDLLGALGCSDGELDLTPVDLRHLGLPGNQACMASPRDGIARRNELRRNLACRTEWHSTACSRLHRSPPPGTVHCLSGPRHR